MDTNQISGALTELALDLRWAWNHAADDLWRQLDPDLWERTGNAWFVLAKRFEGETAGRGLGYRIPTQAGSADRRQSTSATNPALVPAAPTPIHLSPPSPTSASNSC